MNTTENNNMNEAIAAADTFIRENDSDSSVAAKAVYKVLLTYEIVTEESAAEGDAEERGTEDEYPISLPALIELLTEEFNWIESSSWPTVSGHDWLISDDQFDGTTRGYESGDNKTLHLHIKNVDGSAIAGNEAQLFHAIAKAQKVTEEQEKELAKIVARKLIIRKPEHAGLIDEAISQGNLPSFEDFKMYDHAWIYVLPISNAIAGIYFAVENSDSEALEFLADKFPSLLIDEEDIDWTSGDEFCHICSQDKSSAYCVNCRVADVIETESGFIPNIDQSGFIQLL